ncbi:helix-turn-helix transcriptional regulator [Paenirhodobacter ferrireducens]|uniref:helix-turn-helix transcriptional regulator n=1 Tax=Paenirhodobacter ferrireducens TaxID=1215032 RepID=UPI001F0CC5A5|nr:helix-turn-helix transcriptional regulator [Sinirhodobacter ferrireducens]
MHKEFPANLRRLVHHYPSTSRAAEALGINRQQLNKYLSGLSMPSLATLRNIAAHFDLEPDDLLLPPDRFAARWRPPMRIEGLPPRMRQAFAALLENMAQTRRTLSQFCGCYHVCTPLRTNPDRIGRAYTVISQEGDLTLVKTIMYATSRGSFREAGSQSRSTASCSGWGSASISPMLKTSACPMRGCSRSRSILPLCPRCPSSPAC